MSNIVQIKRGLDAPPDNALAPYELGFVSYYTVDENNKRVENQNQNAGCLYIGQPSKSEEGEDKVESKLVGVSKELILNMVYPIGSIYTSTEDKSPATFLGGTWERLKGRFLLGADDADGTDGTYKAGTTGGEAEHTLTEQQIPSHGHAETVAAYEDGTWGWKETVGGIPGIVFNANDKSGAVKYLHAGQTQDKVAHASLFSVTNGLVGADEPHNNMPPYLVVYMWKRIA